MSLVDTLDSLAALPPWLDPAKLDLFEFWRFILTVACFVYAAVVTIQSLWSWMLFLSGPERTTTLMRRYVIIQLLRLRLRPFGGELIQTAIWTVVLVWLVRAHTSR